MHTAENGHAYTNRQLRMPTNGPNREERGTGLALQDHEGLLQARDLSLAALLALLVRHRLRNAPGLQLFVVVQDSVKLCLLSFDVAGQLAHSLLQARLRSSYVIGFAMHP